MKIIPSITTFLRAADALCAAAMAQDAKPTQSVVITKARLFDGTNEKLADGISRSASM